MGDAVHCIECKICLQEYSSSLESNLAPVIVPCGHFVCRGCLENTWLDRGHDANGGNPSGQRALFTCATCNQRFSRFDTKIAHGMTDLIESLRVAYPFLFEIDRKNAEDGGIRYSVPNTSKFKGFRCTVCTHPLSRNQKSRKAPGYGAECGHPICMECLDRHDVYQTGIVSCLIDTCITTSRNLKFGVNTQFIELMQDIQRHVDAYRDNVRLKELRLVTNGLPRDSGLPQDADVFDLILSRTPTAVGESGRKRSAMGFGYGVATKRFHMDDSMGPGASGACGDFELEDFDIFIANQKEVVKEHRRNCKCGTCINKREAIKTERQGIKDTTFTTLDGYERLLKDSMENAMKTINDMKENIGKRCEEATDSKMAELSLQLVKEEAVPIEFQLDECLQSIRRLNAVAEKAEKKLRIEVVTIDD